jgi:TatA/E family protein of Tat protein translocase
VSVGGQEIIAVFLIALIVFGPKRLPEIGRNLGKAMGELRRMSNEVTSVFEDAMKEEKRPRTNRSTEWQHPDDPESGSGAGYKPYNPYADAESAAIGEEVDNRETEDPYKDISVEGSQTDCQPEEQPVKEEEPAGADTGGERTERL